MSESPNNADIANSNSSASGTDTMQQRWFTEYEERCNELAKQIAAPDLDWLKPGMAVRDKNGTQHRCLSSFWWASFALDPDTDTRDVVLTETYKLYDAIGAGPDWRDEATLAIGLLDLGNFALSIDHSAVGFRAHWDRGWGLWASGTCEPSRNEAILVAWAAKRTVGEDGVRDSDRDA